MAEALAVVPALPPLSQEVLDSLPVRALVDLRRELQHLSADVDAAITRRLVAQQRPEQRPAKEVEKTDEYLTVDQLSERIAYKPQSIRNLMCSGQFRLGEHYCKPRGRVVFKWSAVRAWLESRR